MPCHSIESASPVTRSVAPELAGIEIVMSYNSGCCCSESSADLFGGINKIRGREHCLHGLSHVYMHGFKFQCIQIYKT